ETGELDDDVGPLLDDGRLRDAQLVDAVADRLDALAKRVVADLVDLIGIQAQPHLTLRRVPADQVQRLAILAQQRIVDLGLVGGVLEGEDDVVVAFLDLVRARDVDVRDVLVLAQAIFDIRRQPVDLVRDRLADVDVVDEVQAALKVQPQLDLLLEVIPDEARLLLLRNNRRNQVKHRQYGDET